MQLSKVSCKKSKVACKLGLLTHMARYTTLSIHADCLFCVTHYCFCSRTLQKDLNKTREGHLIRVCEKNHYTSLVGDINTIYTSNTTTIIVAYAIDDKFIIDVDAIFTKTRYEGLLFPCKELCEMKLPTILTYRCPTLNAVIIFLVRDVQLVVHTFDRMVQDCAFTILSKNYIPVLFNTAQRYLRSSIIAPYTESICYQKYVFFTTKGVIYHYKVCKCCVYPSCDCV